MGSLSLLQDLPNPGIKPRSLALLVDSLPAAAATKSLQSCLTLCDPRDRSPPGSPVPRIFQARTLGCHFLLQCMKVKSEREVTRSCLILSDPKHCSLPGHGIFQARVLEWGAIAFCAMKTCWCCSVILVVSESVSPHRQQPTKLPCPRDFPGKSTGVGCHCLLCNIPTTVY